MSFDNLALSPFLLQNIARAGFVTPTPIQAKAIPVALSGRDLIGCAGTGTGKTAAFVLPILMQLYESQNGACLILAPTRELAAQIKDTVDILSKGKELHTALILGGVGQEPQIRALARKPRIIIATPGRLIDHLQEGTASLDRTTVLVLDEADRMLDMGFAPQIRRILAKLPKARQTMLFSATMPSPKDPRWKDVLAVGLKDPERIEIAKPQVTRGAEQQLWLVDSDGKGSALLELVSKEPGSMLVFTRTKHRADRVAHQLRKAGHAADRIHGDRSQNQRQRALDEFKRSKLRVLVATDIAARGIDIDCVAHVINYDLPQDPEDYVHRIGRTARAERTGRATSFVMQDETGALKIIERYIGQRLPALESRRGTPAPRNIRRA